MKTQLDYPQLIVVVREHVYDERLFVCNKYVLNDLDMLPYDDMKSWMVQMRRNTNIWKK